MTDSNSQNPSLGEAAGHFLAKLSSEDRKTSQQEIYRFVRWYGWERSFTGLTAPEVAKYVEQLSSSDTNYDKKLEMVRAFLTHAKKQGWSKTNLSTHLKAKKSKNALPASSGRSRREDVSLTRQGYTTMETELDELKNKRPQIIEDIRRAAADKDFRENAPLDAAREQKAYLDGRIMELEETLKAASIIGREKESSLKVSIGNNVILIDLSSDKELHYMLVHPREVDPTKGKISSSSPIGKALIGRTEGEIIEITVPAGKICYQIKQLKR
ncbi:GreA/GreB family elongation factor [Chloroflexota bacterium]